MRHTLALSLLIGSAFGSAANTGFAQGTDIQANPQSSAYLQDNRGPVARSQFGLCWRAGYWDEKDAVTGCDGELLPPVMKAMAPALIANPMVADTENTAPTTSRCSFSATLASEQTFVFGKSTLTEAARQEIDRNFIAPLNDCSKPDVITITGHTDRLGSDQYNRKLSEQRASSVASYLKSKGIVATMNIVGAGKSQAVKTCSDKLSHKDLVSCLSPNRRVAINER